MTTVNSTYNSTATALAQANAGAGAIAGEIQDRFLTLLITQLKNQDPLNPLENAEVTSQLAQMSTVNGIGQLNNTLLAMAGQIDISQSLQATSLVGRDVLVPGEKIAVGEGVATAFGIDVVSPAASVTVSIMDNAGNLVRKIEMDAKDVGVYSVEWDGTDEGGSVVPDGAYRAVVAGADASGNPVTVGTLTYGRVDSVAFAADGLKLDLGLAGTVGLYDIRKVL